MAKKLAMIGFTNLRCVYHRLNTKDKFLEAK